MIDILCVTSKLCIGGVQTFFLNYAPELLKYGIRMNFAVQSEEPQVFDDFFKSIGCNIYYVTPLSTSKFRFMKDIRRILKANRNIKSIHSHLNFANIYPLLAAKGIVSSRISHSHTSYAPKSLYNKILRCFWKISLPTFSTDYWACSANSAKWLYGKRVESEKYYVVNNAISCERFKFSEEYRAQGRKELNLQGKKVWVNVGTLNDVKNHKFLIDLFYYWQLTHKDCALIICGDGKLRDSLTKQISRLGIENSVILAGNITNTEKYLSVADYFVFTSKFEGLPLSVVEAQANGLPGVVSEAVPDEAIVSENMKKVVGFDVDDWILALDKIEKINADRTYMQSIIAEAGFDVEKEAEKLAKRYNDSIKFN